MVFWLLAVAIAAGVATLLARAMLHGPDGEAGASDLDLYRDQLAEVDRDRARGVLDETEADRLRTEVSRRLLDADRKAREAVVAPEPRRATRATAFALALAVLAGALGLYVTLGAPGYPDLPIDRRIALAEAARQHRPGQQAAEAQAAATLPPPADPDPRHAELMAQLRQTVAERPGDVEGQVLLARNEAGIGNFVAARKAQEQVLALRGAAAEAGDWADYALLLVYAAAGYVSPEAEAAIAEALHRDGTNGTARYLSGLMQVQTGRPDVAFSIWRPLLEEAPDAPWAPPVRAQIAEVARMAGIDYAPPAPRGPTGADVAAAAGMDEGDRQEMVRGMVEGLAARLASEGGPAEDWAQLITALGVLGQTDRARAIHAEARVTFGAHPGDLALIEAAATRAGIAE